MLATTPVRKVYNIRTYSRASIAASWLVALGIGAGAMYGLMSMSDARTAKPTRSDEMRRARASSAAVGPANVAAGKSAAQLALLSDLANLTREAQREKDLASARTEPKPSTLADTTPTPEQQELDLLQHALPENILIPRRRTEAELQRQLADIQEQQRLYPQIKDQRASERERHFYYELQAKRFEDELELTDYCDDKLSESDPTQRERFPFCSQISARSTEVHRAAEASLAQLRQELL